MFIFFRTACRTIVSWHDYRELNVGIPEFDDPGRKWEPGTGTQVGPGNRDASGTQEPGRNWDPGTGTQVGTGNRDAGGTREPGRRWDPGTGTQVGTGNRDAGGTQNFFPI